MRRALALAFLTGAATLTGPDASAAFHLAKVQEVYAGSEAEPDARFVEINNAGGERGLGGKQVRFFASGGTLVASYTLPAPPNTSRGSRVLLCTARAAEVFAVTCDLTIEADLPFPEGKVDFAGVDAVSYGAYVSGQGDGAAAGTPATLERGRSLDRTQDTDDSASDFVPADPTPEPNADAEPPCLLEIGPICLRLPFQG